MSANPTPQNTASKGKKEKEMSAGAAFAVVTLTFAGLCAFSGALDQSLQRLSRAFRNSGKAEAAEAVFDQKQRAPARSDGGVPSNSARTIGTSQP
jgi:hypothetical protein